MTLQGIRAIITGANQGFGLAVAEHFVAEGARVFLCARDEARLREAAASVQARAAQPDAVRWMRADVTSAADVDRLTQSAIAALGGLDALVCNAGIYGPKGPIEEVDWDAWVQALNVNLLGTILCCRSVLPHFRGQRHGKIILLSGGGATKPMPFLSAYAASKAAVVRFGETLAGEVADAGIDVNAVAPGALNTRLLDEVLEAGPAAVGDAFYAQSMKQKQSGGTPLETGARLCAFLASPVSDGITGRLISAVWDPWADLPARREELAASDIYTLRRIVPEERGKDWGSPK
jgi:NAD(P)-dependent dehydrogenase (short-subunit alcohol dehydrogenase family)